MIKENEIANFPQGFSRHSAAAPASLIYLQPTTCNLATEDFYSLSF